MKKYVILLVLTILLGFATNNNIKAQGETDCPEGATLREVTFVSDCFSLPGCRFRVVYCCYFDDINLRLEIKIKRIDFLGTGEPYSWWACYYTCYYYNRQAFWAAISQAVKDDAFNTCASWIPDCDEGVIVQIKEYRSQCWYYENFWFTKYEHQWLFVMRPCEGGDLKCIHEFKICRRGTDVIVVEERWIVEGPPNCTTEEPNELPPPGKTWEEYWRTDCFAKPCMPQ